MSPLAPGRRRHGVLLGLAALLAGCAPAGAQLPVGDTAFSSGIDLLDERVAVRMPDGVYLVEALGVREKAFVDGETVRAPDGAVLVEVAVSDGGYVGEWAPGRTEAMLRAGDTEVPVELDPAEVGTQVAVLPGDGGDAELVLSFEGRDAVVSVATADLVGAAPFPETLPWGGTLEVSIEAPAGWYPMVQAAVLADLRLVGYLPERGWAVYPLQLVLDEAAAAYLVVGTVPAAADAVRLQTEHRLTTAGDELSIGQDATVTGPLLTFERI